MFPLKMPTAGVVKSTVKAALKGKRVAATFAAFMPVCIGLLLYSLCSGLSLMLGGNFEWIALLVLVVLTIFILSPALLGTIRWFWRVTDGAEDQPREIFYYFSSLFLYKRALKCGLLFIFKCFTAFFTCLLPYFITFILTEAWVYQFLGAEMPLWVAGLALVRSFLQVVGAFAGFAVISRYYLFPAITVMDDDILLLEALHISVMVSHRSVAALLGVVVSLLGWILLSFLVAPLIYTAPLFFAAYAVHSRYALVNYNLNLDFYTKDKYDSVY
jgi:hypothetical protein